MTALDTATTGIDRQGRRRSTWALWGTAAGVCGLVANMLASPMVNETQRGCPAADLSWLVVARHPPSRGHGARASGSVPGLLVRAVVVP